MRNEQEPCDVCVSIVTYNSSDTIQSCLDSLARQKEVRARIILVDNQSVDATIERVNAASAQPLVIPHDRNIGFGAGHNLALRNAPSSRYVLVLNPDATLASEMTLRQMVLWMDQHPACGLCGLHVRSEGVVDLPKNGYPGQKEAGADFSSLPGSIAWVLGSAMMMKRSLFEPPVSGFDEGFFLYAEETDLCLRVRQAGYEIGVNTEAKVDHVGGVSAQALSAYDMEMQRQVSLHRFYRKHYSEEGIRRIMQKHLWRSNARILGRTLVGQGHLEKTDRYRAIRDACRSLKKELAA